MSVMHVAVWPKAGQCKTLLLSIFHSLLIKFEFDNLIIYRVISVSGSILDVSIIHAKAKTSLVST